MSSGGMGARFLESSSGRNILFKKDNHDWRIADVQFYPPNPRLVYEDLPNMKAKEQVMSSATAHVNRLFPSASLQILGSIGKSGILITMQQSGGEALQSFLKITTAKRDTGNNPIFWQTSEFCRATGFTAITSVMQKESTLLEPSDILDTNREYSIDEIIGDVIVKMASNKEFPALAEHAATLLRQIQSGAPIPLSGLSEFKTAIEIKFGEIAAPIALISGNLLSGQFRDIERNILNPQGYSFADVKTVSFPGKMEPLVDSFLHLPNGKKIGVSSKNSTGGAAPSTSVVMRILREHESYFMADKKFIERYSGIRDDLTILDKLSAINGPLALARKYQMITEDDETYLASIYGNGIIEPDELQKASPHLVEIVENCSYSPDRTNPLYQTGFHMLAVITRNVVDRLNRDSGLTTEFFKTVLSKLDVCQVYAYTQSKGDALCFKNFNVICPATFEGTILISARKSYTSTLRPRGKLSFEFKNVQSVLHDPALVIR